ncbi:MAG: RICIN domain-containing protein [Minicystis sp.]
MSTHRSIHLETNPRSTQAERARSTRTRVFTSLVPLALGLLPAACAPGATETAADADPTVETAPTDAPAKKITLVALTPISRDRAPMLSHLADRFALVDAGEAAERLGTATGQARIDALLEGASALVADVEQLGARDLAAIRPLADAAAEAGVPLVLENIASPDRMAALVGLGFKADGALVESWDKARKSTITLLGKADVTRESAADQATIERVQRAEIGLGYWEMSGEEREAIARKLGKDSIDLAADVDEAIARRDEALAAPGEARPSPERVEASPDDLAEQVAERLVARVENPPLKPMSLSTSTYPIGTYKSYVVQRPSIYTWQPAALLQTATMDIQFKVELVASSATGRKYMVVSDAGSGFNPGTMLWDGTEERGYFQDSLEIKVDHSDPALTSYAHQPLTQNESNTYTVSNGCSFGGSLGVDGPETSFSCSMSGASSTTTSDFSPIDLSAGLTTRWNFRMSYAPSAGAVGGGVYNEWDDLVDPWTGFLRNVPNLAKSNFDPQFETIYWADSQFANTVPLSLQYKQTVRTTWVDWYLFVVKAHTQTLSQTINLSLAADFSRVSTDQAWVTLTAKHSSKCIDVQSASTASGAPVVQESCTEANDQLVEFVKTIDQDGYYLFKPKHSLAYNMCLTVADASTAEGASLVQAPCLASGNDNQKFKLVASGGNYYYLQAKHSGKCLTVSGASLSSGAPIVQQTCANTENQRFK